MTQRLCLACGEMVQQESCVQVRAHVEPATDMCAMHPRCAIDFAAGLLRQISAGQSAPDRYLTVDLEGAKTDLSPGELLVLQGIARGKSNAQIAREMGRSVSTVKNLASMMFLKLGAESRTGAAMKAVTLHLVEPQSEQLTEPMPRLR